MLSRLKHHRIAHLYGIYNGKDEIIVFTEYLPRGSVYDKVLRNPIEENLALKYFRETTEGLRYIHSRHIVHGNIKGNKSWTGKT